MANSFEEAKNRRQQNLKETPTPVSELRTRPAEQPKDDPLSLYSRKRTRQTYTVYLDGDLMEQVKRSAKQRGVSASVLIEACIRKSLEELEQ